MYTKFILKILTYEILAITFFYFNLSNLLKLYNFITGANEKEKFLEKLFYRLDSWFPNDVGCFCIYFLNYIQLSSGQAIYLGANEPHAYIYGGYISYMLFTFFLFGYL